MNNEIKEFLLWVQEQLKKDKEEVTIKFPDFLEEYETLETFFNDVMNGKIKIVDIKESEMERLKIILQTYKDEYNCIIEDEQTNEYEIFTHYNSLLYWYQHIPEELNLFINSLNSKSEN